MSIVMVFATLGAWRTEQRRWAEQRIRVAAIPMNSHCVLRMRRWRMGVGGLSAIAMAMGGSMLATHKAFKTSTTRLRFIAAAGAIPTQLDARP